MNDQENQQFESLKQEVALYQKHDLEWRAGIEKRLNDHEDWMKGFDEEDKHLGDRIKILEEARKVQINLNEGVRKALEELGKKPQVNKPWWKF